MDDIHVDIQQMFQHLNRVDYLQHVRLGRCTDVHVDIQQILELQHLSRVVYAQRETLKENVSRKLNSALLFRPNANSATKPRVKFRNEKSCFQCGCTTHYQNVCSLKKKNVLVADGTYENLDPRDDYAELC